MASRRRQRRKACTRKVRHESYERALAASRSLFHATGEHLNAYHCRYCNGWHIGHIPYRVRQAIHARQGARGE